MINPNSPFKCWNCGRGYTPRNNSDVYCSRLCRKEARKQRAIFRRQKGGKRKPES